MKEIKERIKYAMYLLLRFVSYCCRVFPVNEKKIILNSFSGKGYSDNPKYIAQALLAQEHDLDLVWIVERPSEVLPNGMRQVKKHSLKEIYELCTAKVWIFNARVPLYAAKRKSQFYIETWHGCIGMKKVGDAARTKSYIGAKRVSYDTALTDLMISNSSFTDRLYREDFNYQGPILRCGSPRIDGLSGIDAERCDAIRRKIGIPPSCKTVLYAPTFRDNGRTDVYDINFSELLKGLNVRFGGEWKVLVKLHPVMAKRQDIFTYSDDVINCSDYMDIYELMSVADALVTDYSSVAFEMGLVHKPVFVYARDIQEISNNRGLYFDMEMLPFPTASDNTALYRCVERFSMERYTAEFDKFNECYLEAYEPGNASQSVANYILEKVISHGKRE